MEDWKRPCPIRRSAGRHVLHSARGGVRPRLLRHAARGVCHGAVTAPGNALHRSVGFKCVSMAWRGCTRGALGVHAEV